MAKTSRKLEHWNFFSNKLQKLIAAEVLCDVTLISKGKRFPVNRILLSACSDYFATMFTSSFKERDCTVIEIHDVNAEDLQCLIDFCFTGELDIDLDNAENLLRGAHMLRITTAISCCCDYLLDNLSPVNCLNIWLLAKHLMLKEFESEVFQYCLVNFIDVPDSVYVELNHDELDEVVKYSELTDCDVFHIVMKWIQHEPKARIKYISTFATGIDFNFVDRSDFSKYVGFIRQYREVRGFLIKTLKFYFSSPNDKVSSSRKSTLTPISLSDTGIEIYRKQIGKWKKCNVIDPKILKYNEVLAAHIEGSILYTVSKHPGQLITIEMYDLKNQSLQTYIKGIPYRNAAITFSYPMVYLIGSNRTIFGLNLVTRKVHKFPNTLMSVARHFPGVVVLDNELYVIGGENVGTYLNANSYCTTECFTLSNNTWHNCASMEFPVSDMGITVSNRKIYVLGGATLTSKLLDTRHVLGYTNKFQCYDPITNNWSCLGNFLFEGYRIRMCIWDGKIIATGGISSVSKDENAWVYERDKWRAMGSLLKISKYLFTSPIDYLPNLD